MTVGFKSPATSANLNNAFASKKADNILEGDQEIQGEVSLTKPGSGGDITNVQQQINNNVSDIATNTADIATNAGNIATNTSNISTNTTNIGTNTTNIGTNTTDISNLETLSVTATEGVQRTAGTDLTAAAEFKADINGLTADATPDSAADYVMTYDDSAGVHKKVLLNNLPAGGGGGGAGIGDNLIINGTMDFAQRGASFAGVTNNTYTLDRWNWLNGVGGAVTITQDTDVPTEAESGYGSLNSMKVDVTTADASIAASDYYGFRTKILGYDFQKIHEQDASLTFWVKSTKTGTFTVAFQNGSLNRSYVVEYTVNVTNTWEKKEINLTMDTGGTWSLDSSSGLVIWWTIASGTTFHGTPDAWSGTNIRSTSNQVNAMDNTSNNFIITQVKLEKGTAATEFKRVGDTFQGELDRCEYFYQKSYQIATAPGTVVGTGSRQFQRRGSSALECFQLSTRMRIAPTITWYSKGTGTSGVIRNDTAAADTSASTSLPGSNNINLIPGGSVNDQLAAHYTLDAEL